jgi:uncharacterized repeat protein (TIGR03803 family)
LQREKRHADEASTRTEEEKHMANEIHRVRISNLCRTVATATLASVTALLPAAVTTPLAQAQAFTVLYSFAGPPDGQGPTAALVRDTKGNLYGTTFFGGTGACAFGIGCGTAFKLKTNGSETVLYNFTGGSDGAAPFAGLIRDNRGTLYGTATQGGYLNCSKPMGCGTVFKVDATGQESVLHSFTVGADGEFPYAPLLRDAAGNLYGTTVNGGSSSNYGTVFKVDSTGKETVLHRFKGKADGAFPFGNLISDSAGNLYGTTSLFGKSSGGTVFRLKGTSRLTALHSFKGAQGESPLGGVVRDAAGNFYGTTADGGASGAGTVFKLDTSGKETVLYTFTGGADGANPNAGVVLDAGGNLYGTTLAGGGSGCGGIGCGTVFKVDKHGRETVLYSLTGGTDGGSPYAGLIRDAAGHLYGTAFGGGATGNGVVFRVTTGK